MTAPRSRPVGLWFAAVATVVVGAALVGGVLAVGGPGTARLEKLDDLRRTDLRDIERVLESEWRRDRPTPSALGALEDEGLPRTSLRDPGTDEPYGYRALSDTSAELCATFALAHKPEENTYGYAMLDSEIAHHPAGPTCFTLTVDD